MRKVEDNNNITQNVEKRRRMRDRHEPRRRVSSTSVAAESQKGSRNGRNPSPS